MLTFNRHEYRAAVELADTLTRALGGPRLAGVHGADLRPEVRALAMVVATLRALDRCSPAARAELLDGAALSYVAKAS